MNQEAGRTYTSREAASELVELARHAKDFVDGDNTRFCLECIGKHFLGVRGLAAEGRDFFPEDSDFWGRLRQWADDFMTLIQTAKGLTSDTAAKLEREARTFRKTIQGKYFGSLGDCKMGGKQSCSFGPDGMQDSKDCICLTGFEPCCRAHKEQGS